MNKIASRQPRLNWRIIGWTLAALLLAVPLVAMQFTSQVVWDETDFLVMGVLFAAVGGLLELAVRLSRNGAYRAGFALAVLGGFLTIWVNLAVGIVDSENNSFNLWFFAVLALGAAGALLARFRPAGMVLAMLTMAAAQCAVAVLAWVSGAGRDVLPVLFFVPFWLASAWLFAHSARDPCGAR